MLNAPSRAVRALVANDLRSLLRSSRAVVLSLVLPLLVWPLVLLVSQALERQREERLDELVVELAIIGDQSQLLRSLLAELPEAAISWTEEKPTNPAASLADESIHLWIEAGSETADGASVPLYRIHFRADREDSRRASEKLVDALDERRDERRAERLAQLRYPVPLADAARIEMVDLAPEELSRGLELGRFLTTLVVLLLLVGGSVVASDSLAGEKERGTLETLMTTAMGRPQVVAAKHLVILIVAIVVTSVQLLSLLVYLGLGIIDLPEGLAVAFTPIVALQLLLLYLPVAVLISALLLLTSAYARSYKEAQLYSLPLFLATLLPTLAPLFPALELRSPMVVIPVANLALAAKDILSGSPSWIWIAIAWAVTAFTALAVSSASSRLLRNETLLIAAEDDELGLSGEQLFSRRVLRWVAVVWAIILVHAATGGSEPSLGAQLAFNFGLLALSGAAMLKLYRLPLRATLSLRLPKAGVWPAIAVAVPAAVVCSMALVQWSQRLVPIPEDILRAFDEALIPSSMSLLSRFVLLALLPGVVEELFFRGLVLHGLRRRGTLAAVVLSATLFGIYHVSLFRLLPTAALGLLFALVTVYSGSILPAMLWHTANNAIGVFAGDVGTAPSPLAVGVAAVLLAASLAWIRRLGARSHAERESELDRLRA